MTLLYEATVFLTSAIICVPLMSRLGLGSVLGYLTAGVLIGPWGLGLIRNYSDILDFAELGVVFLLFIIGLELQPSRLWVLRRTVFGMGLAQVLVSSAALGGLAWLAGWPLDTAAVVGLVLSLSSTAFVLQLLSERRQLLTTTGRVGFSILLFQDLAVIPMLALIPLIGGGGIAIRPDGGLRILTTLAVLVLFVVIGRYLLKPVLRFVSRHSSHDVVSATALLVVVGSALLMDRIGLSMALGAFLAGVLLADSEFRHELEADIDPFKGLLLGLFFIGVGMSANLGLLGSRLPAVLAVTTALIVTKAVIIWLVGRAFDIGPRASRQLAFLMPQGGEFAFVLLNAAVAEAVVDRELADLLILAVTLSMAATPLLVAAGGRVNRWLEPAPAPPQYDHIDADDVGRPVIIAGFGRVGQMIGRILALKGIGFTALEHSARQVDFVRRYGNKIYYGDASRADLLRAAGADQARVLVVAVGDMEQALRITATAKRHFPNLLILARARNRHHSFALMDLGVTHPTRETFHSSLQMAKDTLVALGLDAESATRAVERFRAHDEQVLQRQFALHPDDETLIQSTREAIAELEDVFRQDRLREKQERWAEGSDDGPAPGGGARHTAIGDTRE